MTIIGLHVDSDATTVTLPDESRRELVQAIRAFIAPGPPSSRRRPLKDWQRLLGWINWGLNVHPLLRPALQSSYEKIRGKQFPRSPIFLNNDVCRDLAWVAAHFDPHGGVHFLSARSWGPEQADLLIYADASMTGMGFSIPSLNRGFYAHKPPAPPSVEDNIFWYEALTVAAAVEWACELPHPPRRLGVYTDNLNSVQMFGSLRALRGYNDILRFTCGLMTSRNLDLRVWHVPGAENTFADCLSQGLFELAHEYQPGLHVSPFAPPKVALENHHVSDHHDSTPAYPRTLVERAANSHSRGSTKTFHRSLKRGVVQLPPPVISHLLQDSFVHC